jgi:uracil-DNA glycosylase family 4
LKPAAPAIPAIFCRPVPPFGDEQPKLLIVGLAPGLHGANKTGRPFTGDHAGILLYETLHAFGYADAPGFSVSADDGLELIGCRITNAVKCVPPENKPETAEIKRCNAYLQAELAALPSGTAILALGLIAHKAVLMALGLKASGAYVFAHDARHDLPVAVALRQLPLQPLQHPDPPPDAGDVPGRIRPIASTGGPDHARRHHQARRHLSREQKKKIAEEITDTLERHALKPKRYTYIAFEELPDENWAIAGQLLDEDDD